MISLGLLEISGRSLRWVVIAMALTFGAVDTVYGQISPKKFGWLAYGDLRGHLEPCGCDPSTDMGGFRRIMTAITKERAVRGDVLIFGLGNDLPPVSAPTHENVKAPFIIEATVKIDPIAVLVNLIELKSFKELQELLGDHKYGDIPYVLSNGTSKLYKAWPVAQNIRVGDVRVYGYTIHDSVKDLTRPLSDAMIEEWMGAAKKGETLVLLFSGPDSHLKRMIKQDVFDVVISSNVADLHTDPGTGEREDESRLVRYNKHGQRVYMVPLGGQGMLRGGSLQYMEAPSLAEVLGQDQTCKRNGPGLLGPGGPLAGHGCAPQKAGGLIPANFRPVSWLGPDVADAPELADLFGRYNAAASQVFAKMGETRFADLATSAYAGADACESCHPDAVKIWKSSAHSHAMQTLKEKNKHEDPECVSCHVVGAKAKGGFVSLKHSPHLANVQCENCHGPRRAHTKNPVIKPEGWERPKEVCAGCHHGTHSPTFELKSFWKKIEH